MGGPFWSMCANSSTSRALHSSWTEASRGDCISPGHVIIQRSDKCNTAPKRRRAIAGTKEPKHRAGPASSSAHTKTAITAIDAEHALHDGRADADGAADLHLALCPRRAARGRRVTLQTGVPGEGVNSRCNLGNAASATAAPRSRIRTPPAPPAKIASSVTPLGERCNRAFTS
jgi:hypothetical protein